MIHSSMDTKQTPYVLTQRSLLQSAPMINFRRHSRSLELTRSS